MDHLLRRRVLFKITAGEEKYDKRHDGISPEIPAGLRVGRRMKFLGSYTICLFQRHGTSASSCDVPVKRSSMAAMVATFTISPAHQQLTIHRTG